MPPHTPADPTAEQLLELRLAMNALTTRVDTIERERDVAARVASELARREATTQAATARVQQQSDRRWVRRATVLIGACTLVQTVAVLVTVGARVGL